MKMFLRKLIISLKFVLSWKKIFFIIFIFSIVIILKSDYINSQEFIYIMFDTPNTLTDNTVELLTWSIYQFYLIYIIGDYIHKEFRMRNIYTLGRIGSKRDYIIFLYINIFLICLIYYFIGIGIFSIVAITLNKFIFIHDILFLVHALFVMTISGCFCSAIYMIIFLITKNQSMSFIFIMIYVYLSIIIKNKYNINLFISLNLSSFWNVVLCTEMIINLIIIKKIIIKKDMTNYLL